MLETSTEIVFTMTGSLMDDTRTVSGGNVIIRDDTVVCFGGLCVLGCLGGDDKFEGKVSKMQICFQKLIPITPGGD